jgi:hypothetical protein
MYEDIAAIGGSDEAVTLPWVKPLNLSFRHKSLLLKNKPNDGEHKAIKPTKVEPVTAVRPNWRQAGARVTAQGISYILFRFGRLRGGGAEAFPHQPAYLELDRPFRGYFNSLKSLRILSSASGSRFGFKDTKISEFQTVILT